MPSLIARVLLVSAFGAVALTSACPYALASYRRASGVSGPSRPTDRLRGRASATLEGCVERLGAESYGTFAAEMSVVAGSARMAIRMEVQQRDAGQSAFHDVRAGKSGRWRRSTPGVKVFRDVEQVTNLLASREYRAVVEFRWLDTLGRLLAVARRTSPVCGPLSSSGSSGSSGASAGAPAVRSSRRASLSSRSARPLAPARMRRR